MVKNGNATSGEFLLYKTADSKVRIEAIMQDEDVWLTQEQIAVLFGKGRTTITGHISNILSEDELNERVACREFRHTTQHGAIVGKTQSHTIKHYNLDMIIAIGYRVRSSRGTQFRQWATERLHEYIVKGFSMDDLRFKNGGSPLYFEELLARIRDIRSSEKVFWRKILDIYATSIDYDPNEKITKGFFKIIQNKMHWAVHGQTAAEVICSRSDASKPNMGMTNWLGVTIRKSEAVIAKNYLTEEELKALNRFVVAYLEFAEMRALEQKPMTMKDWITKLDDFLNLSEKEVLSHAGKVSHEDALHKAHTEYEVYKASKLQEVTEVERHFIKAEKELKRLESKSINKWKSNEVTDV